jgi:hypothetical protein
MSGLMSYQFHARTTSASIIQIVSIKKRKQSLTFFVHLAALQLKDHMFTEIHIQRSREYLCCNCSADLPTSETKKKKRWWRFGNKNWTNQECSEVYMIFERKKRDDTGEELCVWFLLFSFYTFILNKWSFHLPVYYLLLMCANQAIL